MRLLRFTRNGGSPSLFRAKRRNLLCSSRWHIKYCVHISFAPFIIFITRGNPVCQSKIYGDHNEIGSVFKGGLQEEQEPLPLPMTVLINLAFFPRFHSSLILFNCTIYLYRFYSFIYNLQNPLCQSKIWARAMWDNLCIYCGAQGR